MATQTKEKPSADDAAETPARVLPREITKVGNLTDSPTLDFAKESKRPFARFRLAVERPKVPGDWAGERETTFYSVTCFDTVATNVCETLAKGTRAIVVGRPEIDEWTDKDGKKRVDRRILANAVGPDLRWATAQVTRVRKTRTEASSTTYADDEEPF
jgi:single-strand DNA-binding protein